MSSPALSRNRLFAENNQSSPSMANIGSEKMTIENTLQKTIFSFALLVASAVTAWIVGTFVGVTSGAFIGAMVVSVLVALVLGLVNAFKKEPSVPLILGYSVFEGFAVGAISVFFETISPGIVIQAVLATLVVCAITFGLFASGKVRATPRMTKFWMIAMISYLAFSLVNILLMVTGVTEGAFGLRSAEIFGIPLGLIIGVLAVLMATYSLIMDFTFIQNGVNNKIPAKYGWSAAFGLMVTIVWLYLEILRILAISRN